MITEIQVQFLPPVSEIQVIVPQPLSPVEITVVTPTIQVAEVQVLAGVNPITPISTRPNTEKEIIAAGVALGLWP